MNTSDIKGRPTYQRGGSSTPNKIFNSNECIGTAEIDGNLSETEEDPQITGSPKPVAEQSASEDESSSRRDNTRNVHKANVATNDCHRSPVKCTLESYYSPNNRSNECYTTPSTKGTSWLIPMIIAATIAVVAGTVCYAQSGGPQTISARDNYSSKKNCSFDDLKTMYPHQDSALWKSLQTQIENILNKNPVVPSVFLFLHSEDKHEELIWKIAKTASSCFDPTLEPMKLDNNDFTSKESIADYGVIIKKFKEQIGDGGALVVANLNEIPGKAARALHAICDTYNPIIHRVVIFMTLSVSNAESNPIEIAENTLHELWGASITRNELDPLITRVTEQVFYLENEAH